MQLTNIARDVGEDARAGRLYLPRALLREAGIDPDSWLAAPCWRPEIGMVVSALLADADRHYLRAEGGIAGLPRFCRPAIFAARHLYAAIGAEIARNGFDSVNLRAHVSGRRKLVLMARALWDAVRARPADGKLALAETQFLVDAAAASQPLTKADRGISGRVLWVAELFIALQQRDRQRGVRA
jgi:phytoene synthase